MLIDHISWAVVNASNLVAKCRLDLLCGIDHVESSITLEMVLSKEDCIRNTRPLLSYFFNQKLRMPESIKMLNIPSSV